MRVDQSVIEACKLHDAKAQKIVYERFAPMMLGVCMRYTRTREEAEDIMQEGFLTVFTKIEQFADKGSFEGWVRRIMVNAALMHFRKYNDLQNATSFGEESRISSVPDEVEEEVDEGNLSVKDRIQHADFSRDELLEVIQELPDGFRMVFNLAVFEEYKHKEIADMLGVAEATSKTQLLRARKLIQKKLFEKALAKDKKTKPEKALALLALIMSDELKYIDELFQQGLGDMHVTPAAGWSSVSDKLADNQLSQSALSSSSQTTAGLQTGAKGLTSLTSKIGHFIAGHVQTAIIASVASVVGVTAIVATVITSTGPELPATTPAVEQVAPASQPELIQEEAITTTLPEQATVPVDNAKTSESAESPANTTTRQDSTVYDTVKVIIHEKVVVPKQIRKTIQQKKVIQQPADQL